MFVRRKEPKYKTIHCHIWNEINSEGDPIEIDAEWNDTYDDHFQFIGMIDADDIQPRSWIEIRIPR